MYEKQYARLESSIHESTYRLFMHMALMDMRIENSMEEFELRKRAMVKAGKEMHVIRTETVKSEDEGSTSEAETQPSLIEISSHTRNLVLWTIRRLKACKIHRCIVALTCASLIVPAKAMDHSLAMETSMAVFDPNQSPTVAIGTCTGILFILGGHFMGAAKNMVGPLMGISSVLYFMMRNDTAVKPSLAWR